MPADETSDEHREQGTEKNGDEHQQHSSDLVEKSKEKRDGTDKLSLKDWLALVVAALQTVLLPLVLLLGFLFILTIIIVILF